MTKKFQALRTISALYKLLAVLVFVGYGLFLLLNLAIFLSDGETADGATFLYAVVYIIAALGTYAVGEVIDLLISMEENTRASRIALNQLLRIQASNERRVKTRSIE